MTRFDSSEELYGVFTPFLEQLVLDPVVGPKFSAANTSFQVNYSEPDAVFVLDATKSPPEVYSGQAAAEFPTELKLTMCADDGHKFWLGGLNIPIALAKRKVKIDGPISKLLGMLPAIQPAYAKYKSYLSDHGHANLLD